MNIIIDVILAVVFLAIVIFAAKKGFVLSILEVAAFILAIVLAFQLAAPFSTAIYDGFMGKNIQSSIEEKLPNNAEGVTYAKKASAILDSIPSFYSSYAKKVGIDVGELSQKILSADLSNSNIANELEEKVAKPIVVTVMKGIVFIVLCVLLGFILKFAARGINKMFKLPLIKPVNMLLGAIFGAAKGMLILVFICSALTFIAPKTNEAIKSAVNSSKIVALCNDVNPIEMFKK